MKLMIVESPSKVKKLKSFLGAEWVVKGSAGHIRDLPENELGFSAPDFVPNYVTMKDKAQILKDLRSLVDRAEEVYLATDNDREGEAIAFHLEKALRLKNPKRIVFNEITESAVRKSLTAVRTIDYKLVSAYEGRRVLDRIIGYYVSPELSKKAKIPLSAGRVQSVCLKIIVYREREIEQFDSEAYFEVKILLKNGITAVLDGKMWSDREHIFDKAVAEAIAKTDEVTTVSVTTKEELDYPRAPFITSTLLQAAQNVLGFSPKKTMDCAQALHELGAITYHRTDNPNISEDGFKKIRTWLEDNGLPHAAAPKKYPSKESAQEAHEGIRPCEVEVAGIDADPDVQSLYQLIRERAILSAMPPAVDQVTICVFESTQPISISGKEGRACFKAKALSVKEPSWRQYAKVEKKEVENVYLPCTPREGEQYQCEGNIEPKKTKAPKRYTESDLAKTLERLGIGRPSTYAAIIENIKSRKYVKVGRGKKDKFITPLPTGYAVADALDPMAFMNIQYTNIVEDQLDKIAKGEGDYKTLVTKVHDTVLLELNSIKIPLLIKTEPCPKCGNSLKQIKKRGKDPFWVHIDGEDSEGCTQYLNDEDGKPYFKMPVPIADCPNCGKELKQLSRKDNKGHFWVHSSGEFEGCSEFISDIDGTPVLKAAKTAN